MRVAIRVDGDDGREAGMGHIYRSLAWVSMFLEQTPNTEFKFFMRELPEGMRSVDQEGYAISPLPKNPSFNDYATALENYKPDLLVVDTLGSSGDLMAAGREHAKSIVTFDDLTPSAGDADVIVNGIVWATCRLPERVGRAKVYQGPQYVSLRDQFALANQHVRKSRPGVEAILLSTGGADARGFTTQLMTAVHRLPFECSVVVLVGPGCNHAEEIRQAAARMSGKVSFTVVKNIANMADYLEAADLAILTGGTVMFESAACGTPAVVTCAYEHQLPQARWFHDQGIAETMGFFPESVDQDLVVSAATKLAESPERRQRMSEAGKTAIDGRGLSRIVGIIQSQLC